MKPTITLLISAMTLTSAHAAVVDNFNNTNSALPDLTWIGNTTGFSVMVTTNGENEGAGAFRKTSGGADINTFVTDITTELASNPIYTFSGYVSADVTLQAVNNNNDAALVLLSNTNDAAAIEAGTMNGYRLGVFTGDYVKLQKASGSGWADLDSTSPSTAYQLANGFTFSATIDSSNGNYTWGFSYNTGYATNVVENHAGNDPAFTVPSGTTYGGFTYNTSKVLNYYVDAYRMEAQPAGGEPVPVANPDAYKMYSDITPVLSVAAPGVLDNDAYAGTLDLSALLVDNATNGVLNLSTNGSFTYEPDTGFFGVETFTYKAVTSVTTSDVATVSITVTKEQTLLHYTFDTDLTDSSGNGNDGSYANTNVISAITNVSRFGIGSLALSGTPGSNYVELASDLSFTTEDNWSISLWYNATATNTAGLAGNNQLNYTLQYNPDGSSNRTYNLRTDLNTYQNQYTSSAGDPSIDTGVWHHLVISAEGAGNRVMAYEDGVEMSPSWDTNDLTGMIFSMIGRAGYTATYPAYFNGLIDEVWIMNYALSSGEAASLFTGNTLGGSVPPTPAEIVGWSTDTSDTMKMVVRLDAGMDAGNYSPTYKTDLTDGTWEPVAHSDSPGGTFVVSNLTYGAAEGTNTAIYVKSTNTAEFFQMEAE